MVRGGETGALNTLLDSDWFYYIPYLLDQVSTQGTHIILVSQRGRLFHGGSLSRKLLINCIKRHQNTLNLSL